MKEKRVTNETNNNKNILTNQAASFQITSRAKNVVDERWYSNREFTDILQFQRFVEQNTRISLRQHNLYGNLFLSCGLEKRRLSDCKCKRQNCCLW